MAAQAAAASEPQHEYAGRPGQLTPRWLHAFCHETFTEDYPLGDLSTPCEALPDRLAVLKPSTSNAKSETPILTASTGHELLIISNQSGDVTAKSDDNFGSHIRQVCICKQCKYHFVFNFFQRSTRCSDPDLNGQFLLCHLVLVESQVITPDATQKFHPVTCTAAWKCSAEPCSFEVQVVMSKPRLTMENVRLITDEERIKGQRQRAVAEDPERFSSLNSTLEKTPLVTMNAYLRDTLGQSPKKVAVRNKVFYVQFGAECYHLFQELGFQLQNQDGEDFLVLPRPAKSDGITEPNSERAFYEDTKAEVMALTMDNGLEGNIGPEASTELERALGCLNHNHTARPKQQDDPKDFQILGTMRESSDRLLVYAYQCQIQTDPTNRKHYFGALQRLATLRSDDIQMFAATQASLEETPRQTSKDPTEQAYLHFNLAPKCAEDDDFVRRQYELYREQSPAQKAQHRQMLFRIGKARGSQKLMYVACAPMDFQEACQVLDLEDLGNNPSTEVLINYANMQMQNGKEPYIIAAAMDALAKEFNSLELEEQAKVYRGLKDEAHESIVVNTGASGTDELVDMNLPPGLHNLRNTCYLNSILQYFFTVKAVREVVLNFDPEAVEPTALPDKTGEIFLGREFVRELQGLFTDLESSTTKFVKPKQRLANAAWISAETVQKDKEKAAANNENKATSTSNDVPGSSTPPPLPARPVPPIPSQGITVEPVALVDAKRDNQEANSASSSQTLLNQPDNASDFSYENLNLDADGDEATTEKMQSDTTETVTHNVDNMISSQTLSRNGPAKLVKLSPEAMIGALGEALDKTEISGTEQMDVEEVMGRCINHLRAAINPASVINTGESNNDTDKIKDAFYVSTVIERTTLPVKKSPEWNRHISQERWVTANPAASGSGHLYDALDGYFSREEVSESRILQFTSIVTAPPILHICIQRSNVGGGKNTNPVVIPEVIYLDRYMDSDHKSPIFKARCDNWNSQKRITQLVDEPKDTTEDDGDVPEDIVASVRQEFKQAGDADIEMEDSGFSIVSDNIKNILDKNGKAIDYPPPDPQPTTTPIRRPFPKLHARQQGLLDGGLDDQWKQESESIRAKQADLFADMTEHAYRLHAVICHAGQRATSGHYWVWICDFERGVWRRYNDTAVTERDDTGALLAELSAKGEPYYLAYVRDHDKNDLVSVPVRRTAQLPQDDVEMTDDFGPGAEHVEGGGGGGGEQLPPYEVKEEEGEPA